MELTKIKKGDIVRRIESKMAVSNNDPGVGALMLVIKAEGGNPLKNRIHRCVKILPNGEQTEKAISVYQGNLELCIGVQSRYEIKK